jgi:hypothetical protein
MSVKRLVREVSQNASPREVKRAYLAEPYDGIGQYVLVALSLGSSSSAIARVTGAGYKFPIEAGAPISVTFNNGSIEVVSLGS